MATLAYTHGTDKAKLAKKSQKQPLTLVKRITALSAFSRQWCVAQQTGAECSK